MCDAGTHSGDGCEQAHRISETLELSRSLFDELETGARHQVLHRARGQNFARFRTLGDPCCDVHGDAAHIVAHHLDLTGVDACPNFEIERPHRADDPLGAADSARGPVEQSQESVARGFDFTAAMPLQF